MKAEVDKLDIAKLLNIPTSLNSLKTRLNDLDVGKLKIASLDYICSKKIKLEQYSK